MLINIVKSITQFFIKLSAVAKRDFLIWSSYRFACGIQFFAAAVAILVCYFITDIISSNLIFSQAIKSKYSTDYFTFVFVGFAFSQYFLVSLYSFSRFLRREQMMGTFEALILTPSSPTVIILTISIWHFIISSVSILAYLFAGFVIFNMDFNQVNIISSLVIFVLTFLSVAGIGMISASFVVYFKRGDPISFFGALFLSIAGGAFFPTEVFNKFIDKVSYFLPSTYSLRGMRFALFKGYNLFMLREEIIFLSVFTLIFMTVGLVCFHFSVRKAKQDGTLSHY